MYGVPTFTTNINQIFTKKSDETVRLQKTRLQNATVRGWMLAKQWAKNEEHPVICGVTLSDEHDGGLSVCLANGQKRIALPHNWRC